MRTASAMNTPWTMSSAFLFSLPSMVGVHTSKAAPDGQALGIHGPPDMGRQPPLCSRRSLVAFRRLRESTGNVA